MSETSATHADLEAFISALAQLHQWRWTHRILRRSPIAHDVLLISMKHHVSNRPLTVKELNLHLPYAQMSIHNQLIELTRDGLLELVKLPEDGRKKLVVPTPSCVEMFEDYLAAHQGFCSLCQQNSPPPRSF